MTTAPLKIDVHQHFWSYSPVEYDWIDTTMLALRRDFLPGDLLAETRAHGVAGVVAVQARQSLEETHWLLQLAAEHDFVVGVTGWAPLTSAHLPHHLDTLRQASKLKAMRHFLQAENAAAFLQDEAFHRGIETLRQRGLLFELLVTAPQLAHLPGFVDRHPNQPFVLDHLGKPPIREGGVEPWRTHLRALAERPNVACKLSGLVTEADLAGWRLDDLRPYVDAALEAFGPGRLMFGSDWPVCLLASPYGRWCAAVAELLGGLSAEEQAQVWGGTAQKIYSLSGAPR